MDASSLAAKGRALLQPPRPRAARRVDLPSDRREAIEALMATDFDGPIQWGALAEFLDYMQVTRNVLDPAYRIACYHLLRAWLECVAIPRLGLDQIELIDAFLMCSAHAPEVFSGIVGFQSLFAESAEVFADLVEPECDMPGFACVLSLNYAWPALPTIARCVSRSVHNGSSFGVWLASVLCSPYGPESREEGGSLPLLYREFPGKPRAWHVESTSALRRLLTPRSVVRLARVAPDPTAGNLEARAALLQCLSDCGDVLAARCLNFADVVSLQDDARGGYWLDELR